MMYVIMSWLIWYEKSIVDELSCLMMYFCMSRLIWYEKSIVGELSCKMMHFVIHVYFVLSCFVNVSYK